MTHVLNPKTNRMIKVGGKPWRTLVKEGLITNDPVSGGHTAEPLNSSLIRDKFTDGKAKKFSVRRKNKMVEVSKTPRQEEIAEYTAKCASRTLHKHIDSLSESIEDAYDDLDDNKISEFENNLKNLILEEMMLGEANKPANRNIRGNKRYQEPDTDYELEEEEKSD